MRKSFENLSERRKRYYVNIEAEKIQEEFQNYASLQPGTSSEKEVQNNECFSTTDNSVLRNVYFSARDESSVNNTTETTHLLSREMVSIFFHLHFF